MNATLFFLFWRLDFLLATGSTIYYLLSNKKTDFREALASVCTALLIGVTFYFVSPYVYSFLGKISIYKPTTIPFNLKTALLYFVITDFWFYMTHKWEHKLPLLWTFHGVHHTGTKMNFALSVRGSFLEILIFPLWILPLLLLGFSVWGILVCRQVISIYQIFCHSEYNWPSIISKIFVTPAFHRQHHQRDSAQNHGNYGGILSLWDRWFGSAVRSTSGTYGIEEGLKSCNPIKITFYLPSLLLKKVSQNGWRAILIP